MDLLYFLFLLILPFVFFILAMRDKVAGYEIYKVVMFVLAAVCFIIAALTFISTNDGVTTVTQVSTSESGHEITERGRIKQNNGVPVLSSHTATTTTITNIYLPHSPAGGVDRAFPIFMTLTMLYFILASIMIVWAISEVFRYLHDEAVGRYKL